MNETTSTFFQATNALTIPGASDAILAQSQSTFRPIATNACQTCDELPPTPEAPIIKPFDLPSIGFSAAISTPSDAQFTVKPTRSIATQTDAKPDKASKITLPEIGFKTESSFDPQRIKPTTSKETQTDAKPSQGCCIIS